MSDYEFVKVERADGIAVATLNRPDKLNALSGALMSEIEQFCDELHGDVRTRAVVFAGEGKHFSAGADLDDLRQRSARWPDLIMRRRMLRQGPNMIRALLEIPQITFAALQGGALGGGACIASALDFRVGSESAFVSYPEIHLAMNLSWTALPLCVRLVGPARAKRMVILGERVDARTLLDWGFLDELAPAGTSPVEKAKELARRFAAKPPIQAQMIKRSVNEIAGALDRAVMHMDSDQFLLSTLTQDHAEGIRAFFEKRDPDFKGN